MNISLIYEAKRFALKAHEGLFRKNAAKEPYSTHITEVAMLVETSGGTDLEIAAAWLHDVVEDTDITLDQIRAKFGDAVADIVDGLTDPPDFKGRPIFERKTLQAERVVTKSDSVKRVKIADQISNTQSVAFDPPVEWDVEKCVRYVEGARRIVEQCDGVSIFLEDKFYVAYHASVKRWGTFASWIT